MYIHKYTAFERIWNANELQSRLSGVKRPQSRPSYARDIRRVARDIIENYKIRRSAIKDCNNSGSVNYVR